MNVVKDFIIPVSPYFRQYTVWPNDGAVKPTANKHTERRLAIPRFRTVEKKQDKLRSVDITERHLSNISQSSYLFSHLAL
jgi:hypothetical protein